MMKFVRGFAAALLLLTSMPAPAAAQMLTLLGAGGPAVAAPPPGGCVVGPTLCLIYRAHLDDNSAKAAGTPYSFSSANLGTASADRIVVVAFTSASTGGSFGAGVVTIGGVTATQAVASGGSGTRFCELWYAAVPTGTTGTITVTSTTGTMTYMALDYWTITSTTQTTYSARSGATATNVSAAAVSHSLTLPSGGVIITGLRVSGLTATFAFSGDAGLTTNTDYLQNVPIGNGMGAANFNGTAASHTVTFSNGSSTNLCMGSIAWAP